MSSRGNLSFVQVWLDTVANETKPTKSTNLRPRRSRAHDQSQPLAPTSHNPRFPTRASKQLASRINPARACKNKRWKSMAGDQDGSYMDDEDTKVPAHRGRGRPRGRPATPAARTAVRGRGRGGGQAENAAVMPNATPSTFFDAPDLASQSRSPSRQPSPGKSASSKGRSKTFEAIKADSAIDMMYLENCTPSVHLMSLQEARKSGHVPESVMEMNLSLTDTPGYIPSSLKHVYEKDSDTPQKSRQAPFSWQYLPKEDNSIPATHLDSLKAVIEQVIEAAGRNHAEGAHEGQWGMTVVTPLVSEVVRWPQNRGVRIMNVETCSIEPSDLRMVRPSQQRSASEGPTGNEKAAEADKNWKELMAARMIDCCLGLFLDETSRQTVNSRLKTVMDDERSLNQSMSYIRHTPLFLGFELKKTNQARDPQVQLAIWQVAGYRKKKHHGWDTAIPIPGIVVNGHQWHYYIAFERYDGLVGSNRYIDQQTRKLTITA
ncbi:MAG: hypothetical protein LQ344_004951 [Seirophora lacunosa]|nr:MAG: hypothetical protein LQ344_004951 [Seirophora lacunosa]